MTDKVTNGPENQDEKKKKELEKFKLDTEEKISGWMEELEKRFLSRGSEESALDFITKALQKAVKQKEKSERQTAVTDVKNKIKKFNISSEELKGVLFTKKDIKAKEDWLKEAALGNKKTRIVREWTKKQKEISEIHNKKMKELNDSSTQKASS